MIDKATVERIKDAADIVDVVSDYVHLTRRDSNYMGLCPFHNEKTPSFSVNRRRNFCYCFSCHKGGSPINFIMEKEGVSYHDALLHLANKYGIKVEERELTDEERRQATEREGLLIAANRAMQIMEADLNSSQEGHDIGLSYLYGRGVTTEAIKKFHLGYAIDSGNYITEKMRREGFDIEILRTLGITGKSQSGNLYDKYRGRVIFPIMNSSGKVVGFGGRDLKGGPAKYINSPESTLYHKNHELYGIFQAKSEIVRQDHCFLVEGYLDVISMWQSGLQNVVASSGTALTDGQIALMHRFTENITILYDGDAAGIKAALRGIDMLLSHRMKVSVLLLPDGHDPDSFARAHTPEEFRDYVKANATDIIRFKMRTLMQGMGDSAQSRAEVVSSMARSIACIPDDIQRTLYVSECSRELKIDESVVASAVANARVGIIEQYRADRRRRELENESQSAPASATSAPAAEAPASAEAAPAAQQAPQPLATADRTPGSVGDITRRLADSDNRRREPLRPLECNIVKYLIRYGYMQCDVDNVSPIEGGPEGGASEEAEDAEVLYTVVDFVNDELHANELAFEVPEYRKVFDTLYDHIDEYVDQLDDEKDKADAEIARLRAEGRQEIASKGYSSIADIERAEQLLESRLAEHRSNLIKDFSRDYPGDYLASHEDADLRKVATELLNDRHVLSSLFTRNSTEAPDDNLSHKISRAIAEWKSELLAQHLKGLLKELEQSDGSDLEQVRNLQVKIASIMRERTRLAKDCGERIVSSQLKR